MTRDGAFRRASGAGLFAALCVSIFAGEALVRLSDVVLPGVTLLQKPFTPAALAAKVREVLDA